MAFLKKALKWMSPGIEPSEEKKQQGFQNGEFPSAGHFDFMFKSTADAIEELQAKAGEVKTVNGQLPNANGNIDVSIDTNLLATKEELATHKLDSTAHGIGDKSTLKTTEKNTLVGAVNELFIDVSDGKTLIANAITGKNGTASSSDTFTQLASAISEISTGKKWATGTTNDGVVNGLNFTPTVIVARRTSGGYYAGTNTIYIDERYLGGVTFSDATLKSLNIAYGNALSPNSTRNAVVIQDHGFSLGQNSIMQWLAFE